jgi:hypothetical protein
MGCELRWGSSLGLIGSGNGGGRSRWVDRGHRQDSRFWSTGGLKAFLVGGKPNLFSHEELFSTAEKWAHGRPFEETFEPPGPT